MNKKQKKNSVFAITVFFFGYFALMAGSLPAAASTLAVDGKATASIIVSDSATVPEQTAAKELADYLGKVTGGKFVITTEDQAPKLKTHIYVGHTSYAKEQGLDLATFNSEQWVIRTIGKNLVLAGGRPRGTLYAVYHFLEDIVGVHWWSPWEEHVPSRPNLRIAALDRQGEPVFWMRALDTFHYFGKDARFSARNRINRDTTAGVPFEYGGGNEFGPPYMCHTESLYFRIIQAGHIGNFVTESFEKHPEWVAMKDGQRQIFPEQEHYKNQLCLSNPELRLEFLRILKENFISKTRNQPVPPMVFDVSLNDVPSLCQCDACQAIVKKYGGFDSGLLLDFVNYMADGIKEEYPGVLIETLAYLKTEDIPRDIVPRPNVMITLSDTKSSYTEPISENGYLAKRLQDWSKITDKINVWKYYTCFTDPATPVPFEYTFQPDLKLFRKHKVIGVFGQFEHPVFEEMRDLRLWLLAKLYEDPYQDQDALIKTFTDGFYGPAGVYIRKYINELGKAAKVNPGYGNMNIKTESCKYLTPSFILKTQKYFDKAEKKTAGSDILLRRVRHARLAIDKATLALFPKIWNQWQADGKKPEDLPLKKEQIAARLKDTVETQWKLRADDIYDFWRDTANGEKKRFLEKIDKYLSRKLIVIRPPAKFAHLPEDAYTAYPADTYGIYGDAEIVEDQEAESGIANRTKLTAQLLSELNKNALKWDMHDYTKKFTGKEPTIKCLKPEDVSGPGYHWYKLGTYPITKDNFLWIYGANLEVNLSDAYDPVDTAAQYDIWAQIKFEGPGFPYGKANDQNVISIERVVVVKSQKK